MTINEDSVVDLDLDNNEESKLSPIEHIIHYINDTEPKPRALLAALALHKPKTALITCNEASEAELLARYLLRYGFKTEICTEEQNRHGARALVEKLTNDSDLLAICQNNLLNDCPTQDLSLVINYDFPEKFYLYEQIAHLNQAGSERKIVNLLSSKDSGFISANESQGGFSFLKSDLPGSEEVKAASAARLLDKLNEEAQQVELGQFEDLASALTDNEKALPALAFLLKNYLTNTNSNTKYSSSRNKESSSRSYDRPKRDRRSNENRHDQEQSQPDSEQPDFEGHLPSTKLYITLGRNDGFNDLASLAQFISERTGVDLGHFSGTGMVRDHSAHVEVDTDVAQEIIQGINGAPKPNASINNIDEGANIVCELAKPSPNRQRRPHHRRGHRPRRH